jgi:hypothetical protein
MSSISTATGQAKTRMTSSVPNTYEYERSALDDRRVAVIKEYAAKYSSLTDSESKAMA